MGNKQKPSSLSQELEVLDTEHSHRTGPYNTQLGQNASTHSYQLTARDLLDDSRSFIALPKTNHIMTWGCSIPHLMCSSSCVRTGGCHHPLHGSGHTERTHLNPALSSQINLVPQLFLNGLIYHLFSITSVSQLLDLFQPLSKSSTTTS